MAAASKEKTGPSAPRRNSKAFMEMMKSRRVAAADPTRARMLARFQEDGEFTVKELGEALGLGPNGLYYHVGLLENAGLIAEVGTRPTRRHREKTYAAVADAHIEWEPGEDLALAFAAQMEAAKHDVLERVYESAQRYRDGEHLDSLGVGALVSSPSFLTSRDRSKEFVGRLHSLIKEFRELGPTPGAAVIRLTVTSAVRERAIGSSSETANA